MTKQTFLRDLDKFDDLIDATFGNDSAIRKGLNNLLQADNPEWVNSVVEALNQPEIKQKISESSTQHWQDPKFREKNIEGKKRSWANDIDRKEKLSKQSSQPKNVTHKQNMSKSQLAFYQTPEGKKALEQKAEKQRGKVRRKETCPHCGKEGGEGIMKRWHFDNCKHK